MSDRRNEIRTAFDRHDTFRVEGDDVIVETSPFEMQVSVDIAGEEVIYELRMTLPSLAAVVEDERVSDVVLEGWAETLERRLREAHDVTRAVNEITYTIDWDRETVTAAMQFRQAANRPAPTDAIAALANYVEGTYLQGVIPGYTYGSPVDEMLSQARQRADESVPEPPSERDADPSRDGV